MRDPVGIPQRGARPSFPIRYNGGVRPASVDNNGETRMSVLDMVMAGGVLLLVVLIVLRKKG